MIQNRDWMNQLKEGLIDTDDIAVIFREPNDFDVAKLLSEEDFSIEENANISEKVQLTLDKIYSTAPIIKPTSIPYEQSRMQKVEFEGYEYSVIDFSNPNLDLHRYGFPQGTKKEDVRLLTHFMKMNDKNSGNMSVSGPETMYILCDEVNNTSLSAALIDPNDIRVNVMGRNCAVILEPMSSNYAAAYHDDFTSPLKKGYQEFKDYLLGNLTPEQRNYVSNIYKQVLNLSDDEYIQLYKKLPKKGDISRIKSDIILNKGTINEKIITAEELQNAIKTANNSLYNISGNWSELIIYNPKIKALLYKIENPVKYNLLENCPVEVLEFARKHKLPIIIAN